MQVQNLKKIIWNNDAEECGIGDIHSCQNSCFLEHQTGLLTTTFCSNHNGTNKADDGAKWYSVQ